MVASINARPGEDVAGFSTTNNPSYSGNNKSLSDDGMES
jgi:hypothetical protein